MPRKFRRTGLRRHKSIGTQITIQYCTYLNLSSAGSSLPAYMTANYHMQNIMQNLISSAPNFTNLIQAYEYVALKRARVTYFNTGIHNLGNVTNNTNYPPVHAAIYYDSYSNPVGSGLTRHWFCRRCRVLSLSWPWDHRQDYLWLRCLQEAQHALLVSDCYCFG